MNATVFVRDDARIEWHEFPEDHLSTLILHVNGDEVTFHGKRDALLALIQSAEASILENDEDVTVIFGGEPAESEF